MIIPQEITKIESKGEIIVFNKFKNEASDLIVLHSVFLHNHVKNLSGEIDFLVLAPNKGIFCLELKHGGVSREQGKWRYKDTFSNKGPFSQATDGMHSLRNWLLDQSTSDRKERLKKILFGTGVIFSGVTTPIALGAEGEQWQVLYRDALINNEMWTYIDSLSKNWHRKHKNQYWHDDDLSRPTDEDCQYILKILRNDFNREYTTLNAILDTETTIKSFTEEQLRLLDLTFYNDRCLIEGYAGTGKTVLALELFKNQMQKGLKVGFFCYNKHLAQDIKTKIENVFTEKQLNESFVASFHSYMLKTTQLNVPNEDLETFFNYKLPMEFLLTQEESKTKNFDAIIIDEAQDILNENNLMVLDQTLKNGLSDGKWMFFGDFFYQNLYNKKVDFVELIKKYSYFTRLSPLTINCRNTKRISKQNNLLTGVDYNYENSFQVDGAEPNLQFIDLTEEALIIVEIIKKYISENVPLNQIILLSPNQYENSSIFSNHYLSELIKNGKIEYSTIHSFKGLERNIAIIFGIKDLSGETVTNLLYTGISRAKTRLHLLIDERLQGRYRELITKNLI